MRAVWISTVIAFAIALSSAFPSTPAAAWGKFGHLTICDLAYRNLTPASRTAMNELLQNHQGGILVKGRGKLPDRRYTSFNMGCLEEDELPRQHDEDHFINVARNVRSIVDATCPGGRECILDGIKRDLAILGDSSKSREERVFAMMALGHWIGDIHQPLHVSFADDKGGNYITADVVGRCGTSPEAEAKNLHAVWDKCLLDAGLFERVRQRADFNRAWSRFTITYRAVDTMQANTGIAEERAIVGTEPWKWADESFQIAISPATLYCTRTGDDCRYSPESIKVTSPRRTQSIGQDYLAAYQSVAQDRVRRAGFRLAHLLNLALDPSYREPVRDPTQGV